MKISHSACYRFSLAMRKPLQLGGRIFNARYGALLALESDDGHIVWGEMSPLPGFSGETMEEAIDRAHSIARSLCGIALEQFQKQLTPGFVLLPSVFFAFTGALAQLAALERNQPLHHFPGVKARERVPLCALLTGDAAAVEAEGLALTSAGTGTIKVKVGANPVEEDITLVRRLKTRLGGACRFRFDANRAWTWEAARCFCDAVTGPAVEYVEEPLQDPTLLPALYAQTGVPYAVDETLQALSAAMFSKGDSEPEAQAVELRSIVEQAQALVWKPSLCMPPQALRLRSQAPVVLSSAYESGVATALLLAHAAGQGRSAPAPGVDTYRRLAEDVLDVRLPVAAPDIAMEVVATALSSLNPEYLTQVWHV